MKVRTPSLVTRVAGELLSRDGPRCLAAGMSGDLVAAAAHWLAAEWLRQGCARGHVELKGPTVEVYSEAGLVARDLVGHLALDTGDERRLVRELWALAEGQVARADVVVEEYPDYPDLPALERVAGDPRSRYARHLAALEGGLPPDDHDVPPRRVEGGEVGLRPGPAPQLRVAPPLDEGLLEQVAQDSPGDHREVDPER